MTIFSEIYIYTYIYVPGTAIFPIKQNPKSSAPDLKQVDVWHSFKASIVATIAFIFHYKIVVLCMHIAYLL